MGLRLAADENFDGDIVRGLRLRNPDIDIVRVQDVGLRSADDPTILAWAATEGRALLTHDVNTVPGYAQARVAAGERMPGVFAMPERRSIRQAVEDLLILAECSVAGEWEGQVRFLPL